jgi:cell envelope-related Asp23 family protein
MGIEYGKNILQTVDEVRRRITDRVQNMTGLKVAECNATITDIVFPEGEGRGQEDGRRRELEGGSGYEEYETRQQVRRTEGFKTGSQERETQDAEATYTATRETSSTEHDTRRETGEVRVEGEPLEGDETAELRLEDDEAYRDRRSEEP